MFAWIKCCIFLLYITLSTSLIDCDNVLDDNKGFTGLCNNKWSNLKKLIKPTQSEVGYAWVQKKLQDYESKSKAQAEMDDNPIPCVIGPDNYYYIVDHHHELCALDYSGFTDVSVTLHVICDYRSLPTINEFWNLMIESSLVYLGIHPDGNYFYLPVPIEPSQLPQKFSFTSEDQIFGDDPWRSLGSFVRKVNSYYSNPDDCTKTNTDECYRAYYRGCIDGFQPEGSGVAFFEFRWGYYFLDVSYFNTQYWPSTEQQSLFLSQLSKQIDLEVGQYDLEEWSFIASLLIPVARSDYVGSYYPPSSIFFSNSTLPGFIVGQNTQILNDDPSCDTPSCMN